MSQRADLVGTVIILSSVRWDFTWQRHQAFASAAARDGWDVVFYEPHPRSPIHLAGMIARSVRQLAGRSSHHPAPGVRVERWRPGFTRRVRAELTSARECSKDVVVIAYVPSVTVAKVAGSSPHVTWVYDRVLEWGAVPRSWFPPRRWRDVESEWLRKATRGEFFLVTDSVAVAKGFSDAGAPARVIPPAVDHQFLRLTNLEPVSHGPIGYFGAVRPAEVDVSFLCELARLHPVEVIGPCDPQSRRMLEAAGAQVSGPLTLDRLVARIADWRSVVLPYKVGPRTATLVPAKIWNAIATGKPVYSKGLALDPSLAMLVREVDTPAEVLASLAHVEDSVSTGEVLEQALRGRTWDAAWLELLAVAQKPCSGGRHE